MSALSCWSESTSTARAKLKIVTMLLVWCVCCACREQSTPAPPTVAAPTIAAEPAPAASLESAAENPCQQRVATWEAAQSTITAVTVAERLAQLREAAAKVGKDPEGCTAELIDSAAADELRKVVVLEAGGEKYPAAVIYSCAELSEGTQCTGRTADDTAHLGEVAEDAPAVPAGAEAKVALLANYPLTSLQWYGALDSALLDDAHAAQSLPTPANGTFVLPDSDESNLLFAIGRGPTGEFHKWVWLVR